MRIVYRARKDATPEAEVNTLASVYKFVLSCHATEQRRPTISRPDGESRDVSKEVDGHSESICALEVSDLQLPGKNQEAEQIASGKENHK